MRAIVIVSIGMFILVSVSPVLAAKGGEKGPATQAYEHANENASFKRDDDWKEKKKKKKEEEKAEREKRAKKKMEMTAQKIEKKAHMKTPEKAKEGAEEKEKK